jgi:hypothetical protein
MTIPIIVLIVSLIIQYMFICDIFHKWIDMSCFWGRVAFRQRNGETFNIEYKFTIKTILIAGFVCSIPGMLWSIIKLATM